jgi:hypothetical protein
VPRNLFRKRVIVALSAAFLVVMLLFPTAIGLVPVTAAQSTITATTATHGVPLPTQDPVPLYAKAVLSQAEQALANHTGWTADISWSPNSAHLDYIGPADQDPGAKKAIIDGHNTHALLSAQSSIPSIKTKQTSSAQSLDTCTKQVFERPVLASQGITKDISASGTAIQKEVATYSLEASGSNSVWFYSPLNAFNSNNNYWIQLSPYYDSIGSDGGGWHIDYYIENTNTGAKVSGFPAISVPLIMNSNDNAYSFIEGTGNEGQYIWGATDLTNGYGDMKAYTLSGDTGTYTINLGRVSINGNTYDSAGMVEEENQDGQSTWNFGTFIFNYGFYDTLNSNEQTDVSGYFTQCGYGAVASPQPQPASETYRYDPAIEVDAQDQSGNSLSGLYATVYNSARSIVATGYTPLYVEVSSGGTYYVDYDNYGSDYLTSVGYYPTVTAYSVAGWGGEATINVPSSGIAIVNGIYGTNPGCSCNLNVASRTLSSSSITGFYMQLYNDNTNIANGWTPVTFGGLSSGTYTVYANNYCNISTHQQFTFSRWGDGSTSTGDTVSVSHDVSIVAYYQVTSC